LVGVLAEFGVIVVIAKAGFGVMVVIAKAWWW
jgi:hypothetical protein